MKKKKISGVWAIVGVVVAIAVIAWLLSRGKKDDTVNFTTEAVAPANIENSVTATGSIEAVKTVTVGTQVSGISGIIDKLYVDYNSVVKKGQVIAELDKQNLLSQLYSSKAALSQAQANLTSAMSDLAYQKANYQRYRTLYNKGLIAANDYEQARLSWQTAAATVAERRDAVTPWPRPEKRSTALRPTSVMRSSPRRSTVWSSPRVWRRVRPWRQAILPLPSSPLPKT